MSDILFLFLFFSINFCRGTIAEYREKNRVI